MKAILIIYPETPESRMVHLDEPSFVIGNSPNADICIESELLSDAHVRIEHKPEGDFLISLVNRSDVFVNGAETSFHQLAQGDLLTIGDVKAVYKLTHEQTSQTAAEPDEGVSNLPMIAAGNAMVAHGNHGITCPRCGAAVAAGLSSCPHCGMPVTNLPALPSDYITPIPMSQVGAGIMPVLAFLLGLTVLGAPVALALGLISLSVIRRRGGTKRDQLMAKWAIGLGLTWIMLGGLAAGELTRQAHKRAQRDKIEVYEAQVIRALKNLACAQKYAHTIEFYDADADGFGEYGGLAELDVLPSPFFDAEIADGEAFGYQFTVREASEGRFLAIAEPLHYESAGGRTFAIDQTGQIRGQDADGKRFSQIASILPILQGERSAFYELDDEIAKDVLNYIQTLSSEPEDQLKKQRILMRLRKDYALTTVGRELEGIEATVNHFVTEQRAETLYLEAQDALATGEEDVALAKLTEIYDELSSYSKIAAVERELFDVRSVIAQRREAEAQALFDEAERQERMGDAEKQEVRQLYQRIEKLYPDTDVARRILTLKPELQRQFREENANDIFSDLMELSPESDHDRILSQANQLRRSYNDTELFQKIEEQLARKERKARAYAWRYKTEENMAAGRMRGALAQLESAFRENPDLQYDLRDLCIPLYRYVGDIMLEEGDTRGALQYYTELNNLLKMSGGEETVDKELLARLHKDVGMADFEQKAYPEARWHLTSAAWHYQDEALFNMRYGAASLYTGLYRPAEEALTRALKIHPDMESALLYRTYLNLRIVLAFERVMVERLQEQQIEETEGSGQYQSQMISDDESSEERTTLVDDGSGNFTEEEVEDEKEPEKTIRSRRRKASPTTGFFSDITESDVDEFSTLDPTDLDFIFRYNYDVNRNIMPDLLQFMQDVQNAAGDFEVELRKLTRTDKNAVKLGQVMVISEFRNQLSDLRAVHLEDLAAQEDLIETMTDIARRLHIAENDMRDVSARHPEVNSLCEHILPFLSQKKNYLVGSINLLEEGMKKENELRARIFKMAETSVRQLSTPGDRLDRYNDASATIQNMLYRTEGISEIDQALLLLRDSIEVDADLKDILRAAERVN